MLKQLTKVRIEFNPRDARASAALEFMAQCNSRKAVESNPDCQVTVKRRTDDCIPRVVVTYQNGKEEAMDGTQMHANQMRKHILRKAEMFETEQLFREVGLQWPEGYT